MDLPPGVVAAVTSAAVSTLTTFLLQGYLAKRIELRFARDLEQYKAQLAVRMQTEHGIATRRLEAYPKIVELCYRTRNMARDLAGGAEGSRALRDELLTQGKSLEDLVFRFRIDLEADRLFVLVHRYKNLILEFVRGAPDALSPQPPEALAQFRQSFLTIEPCYNEVVSRLSQDGMYHQQGPDPNPPNTVDGLLPWMMGER